MENRTIDLGELKLVPYQLCHGINITGRGDPEEAIKFLFNKGYHYNSFQYPGGESTFSFNPVGLPRESIDGDTIEDNPLIVYLDNGSYSFDNSRYPFVVFLKPEVSERIACRHIIDDNEFTKIVSGSEVGDAAFEDIDIEGSMKILEKFGIRFPIEVYGKRGWAVNEFIYAAFVSRFYLDQSSGKDNSFGVQKDDSGYSLDDVVCLGMGLRVFDIETVDKDGKESYLVKPYHFVWDDIEAIVARDGSLSDTFLEQNPEIAKKVHIFDRESKTLTR